MIAPRLKETGAGNRDRCMSTFVRGAVMVWSASMLTSHYLGVVKNMDATFIAGLFTSTLATFGVTQTQRKDEESQIKRKSPPSAP